MQEQYSEAAFEFVVGAESVGLRADRYIQQECVEHSRSSIQRWFELELIRVDGKVMKKSHKMVLGQKVQILELPESRPSTLEPEQIPLDIRYEDEDLLVLYKPKNLVVHPGNGVWKGTLAAGLLYHYQQLSGLNGHLRPGIVHRLDKDTSGLMVVARHDQAHAKLSKQLEDRSLSREYTAIVWGHPPESGTVDAPLDRDPNNRLRRAVCPGGKAARTHFRVVEYLRGAALIRLKLESGRTHQIRVHMSYLGHPVLGDPLYGGREDRLMRTTPMDRNILSQAVKMAHSQCLEATEIAFIHPRSGEILRVSTDVNAEIESIRALLGLENHENTERS